jgi:hypothetical protein
MSKSQKFAILIKPENFDLIVFMNLGIRPNWMDEGKFIGYYYTFTISPQSAQNIRNRKIENRDDLAVERKTGRTIARLSA